MKNDTKIGVVLGLNIAVESLFKKIWDTMHIEAIMQHEPLAALSDDLDTITELLGKQRLYIEEIDFEQPIKEEGKTTLTESKTPEG